VDEWLASVCDKASINELVFDGMVLDREVAGWRPARGEAFPTPNSNELVVFTSFFLRGFGIPDHPFLLGLLEYYKISLCNMGPNSILHVTVFIHFYEAYLGILPHFNLFRHFFCLKSQGGSGSRIVGSVYLQLRDGIAHRYIAVPLNTNVKFWNQHWFYMPRVTGQKVRCDIDQIPVSNAKWSERPSNQEMEQVHELLALIDRRVLDGIVVG
jgi:hypothetical protein